MNSSEQPLVAIGIPVYNGEKYIEECLNSIKNQTYENWECVVVNNCSTDKTAEIVKRFEVNDKRFKLLNQKKFVDLVANWNRIYPNIPKNAKYLKIVQADDWLYPEAINSMVELLEKYPSAGMCTSYRLDGNIVNCDGLNFYDGPLFNGKDLLLRHLKLEIDISGSVTTPLFRMSVLEELPTFPKIFDDDEYHIDTRIFYEMMLLADVAFSYKVLSYTRWHPDAETLNLCFKVNTFINGRENRLFRFKKFFPELENEYKKYRLIYAYFYLKEKIKGNKQSLEWHNKYLRRRFTSFELTKAALTQNRLINHISLLLHKKKKASSFIKVNS